jgi:hypothetical protein
MRSWIDPFRPAVAAAVACTVLAVPGAAQAPADPAAGPAPRFAPTGTTADDDMRLAQLLGRTGSAGYLIRSPSSTAPSLTGGAGLSLRWELIAPHARLVHNSDLPFSQNQGAMWAGRGSNYALMVGVRAALGPLTVTWAPEWFHQQNLDFQTIVNADPERSPWASVWHLRPESIDQPQRFGPDAFTTATPGQSSITLDVGPVTAGAATENQWWGPGIRNAIVMSTNAAGIPHVFLRTRRPLESRLGVLDAKWMLGRLEESQHFDFDDANDLRSFSGLAIAFAPGFDRDLTLGLARAVVGTARGSVGREAAGDAFRSIGQPNAPRRADPLREPGFDQILSLFARWVFPASGFEAYAEWARLEEPTSLRDLIVEAQHSQGYTLGLQWARPVAGRSLVRLQAEATNLEPSSYLHPQRLISSYTSRGVEQGYTHRGQVIGAAIGPGASGQWFAADYLAPRWRAGAFAHRVRWETAAFYTSAPNPPPFFTRDVTVLAGVRGGVRLAGVELTASASTGRRYNYLFQNTGTDFGDDRAVDIRNRTFELSLTPLARMPGGSVRLLRPR